MEGSADVALVFVDKDVAEETAERLNAAQEVECRTTWKDRWRRFAIEHEVEAHPVQTNADEAVARWDGE